MPCAHIKSSKSLNQLIHSWIVVQCTGEQVCRQLGPPVMADFTPCGESSLMGGGSPRPMAVLWVVTHGRWLSPSHGCVVGRHSWEVALPISWLCCGSSFMGGGSTLLMAVLWVVTHGRWLSPSHGCVVQYSNSSDDCRISMHTESLSIVKACKATLHYSKSSCNNSLSM